MKRSRDPQNRPAYGAKGEKATIMSGEKEQVAEKKIKLDEEEKGEENSPETQRLRSQTPEPRYFQADDAF